VVLLQVLPCSLKVSWRAEGLFHKQKFEQFALVTEEITASLCVEQQKVLCAFLAESRATTAATSSAKSHFTVKFEILLGALIDCKIMASKKPKSTPTDEELLAQFEDLGTDGPASKPIKTNPSKAATKHISASAQSEQDLLAELGNLATQRPASRPSTPSLKSTGTAGVGTKSPKRTSTMPPTPGGRSSEERSATGAQPRKSGESTRSFHQSFTPATTEESPEPEPKPAPAASAGGGWWGGILSTATAAVNQAQAAVKEIQKNEEAQRWAEQMRGNVGALKGFGA
jgi:Family of unknown function (DUF5427)